MTQMRIRVVQIFHYAFSPLKTFFAESTPAIECHNRRQVLQFHTFIRTQLEIKY